MNNNVTEKLNKFSALVMRDAEEKRSELMEKVEKEYAEKIDAKENEFLEGAYENIQSTVHEAHRAANERVLHAELDAKKRLILKREEIISEVLCEAREELQKFRKSDEYEAWLVKKTETAIAELGDGKKTVSIAADDCGYKDRILAVSDGLTVVTDNSSAFSGGIKVVNHDKKTSVNYSFDELLSQQKQRFLRESNLTID